jgi:hypothetical protein
MRYLYERPRERRVDPSQQSDGPIDIEYQVHDEESRK